jgi:RNA polymerase sigma-70 factor (ECF subfamily)
VSALDLGGAHDRDLLKGIAQGDLDAFVGLFDRYAPTAMALAQAILRQPHLAEEAVQEAFLAVWRAPARYRVDRGTVRSWLLSTVHHRAVDVVRREESQRRRPAQDATDQAPADPGEVVVEEVGLAEDRKAVRRALEELRPKQRQIIELMYFGGLSQTRISERLSLPLGTVKSRTLLGMRCLRTALGGLER